MNSQSHRNPQFLYAYSNPIANFPPKKETKSALTISRQILLPKTFKIIPLNHDEQCHACDSIQRLIEFARTFDVRRVRSFFHNEQYNLKVN